MLWPGVECDPATSVSTWHFAQSASPELAIIPVAIPSLSSNATRQSCTMSATRNDQVYQLLSVNTAPERAARMIAKLTADVRADFHIVHCGNAESRSRQRLMSSRTA
jgi:hypothetical protein